VKGVTEEFKYQLVGECYIPCIMDGEALVTVTGADIIEIV
jgi:hypothetical protein